MRIIAGRAGGLKLKSLKGRDVRPTLDRVKESMFNIIAFYLPGTEVLDLFAGFGSLGIEALSRGAKRADFVEINKS
ncbi:MAG: RsmD family RNA methyltransferase, partial [bacterium]